MKLRSKQIEVRDYLIRMAAAGETTTYQELADICKLNWNMKITQDRLAMNKTLFAIGKYEILQNRPLLPVVVVRKDTGVPGPGFLDLGRFFDVFDPNKDDSAVFVATQAKKVHDQWSGW